jgi:hypothetical protein
VAVKFGARERRVGRRTVAQLVSSEAGKLGRKTIVQRILLHSGL